jgi:polar amino acid transport system permease protein
VSSILEWFKIREGIKPNRVASACSFLVIVLLFAVLLQIAFVRLQYHWNWSVLNEYRTLLIRGWGMTLLLSSGALVLSLVMGLLLAMAGQSSWLPLRHLHRVVIELIRGTPLLVQILIFFYVVADAYGIQNRYVVGVLTLALFSAAYIAEIIRAGIESVGATQWESARAIGMNTRQIYRHVVFPQALRQSLPPMAGQFVSLIKDSSLLSIIGIAEFTKNARDVNSLTFSTLESYLPLAIGYLILTLPISWWTRSLERRVRFET